MQQPPVDEHVRQQPPPLARERKNAHVGAPSHQFTAGEVHDSARGKHHAKEYRGIDAEDDLSETDARCPAPRPRRPHHRLPLIFHNFTPLRRLVLFAPRADLLPKRKSGNSTPASYAVRHGVFSNEVSLEEYQHFEILVGTAAPGCPVAGSSTGLLLRAAN